MEPEISVVIPAYNAADTIGRALRSIGGQGLDGVEVVVVDDGSQDDLVGAVAPLREAIDLHLVRQANGGPGAARNTGLRLAKGRYVALLDADDELLPGSLARRREVLSENLDVGMVFHDFLRVEEEGSEGVAVLRENRFAERFSAAMIRQSDGVHVLGRRYFELAIKNLPLIRTSTVMLRAEAVEAVGGFRTDLRAAEDVDYWFRVAERRPIAYLEAPLVRWFCGGDQLSRPSVRFFEQAAQFYEGLRPRARQVAGLEPHLDRQVAENAYWAGYFALDDGRGALARRHLLRACRLHPRDARFWSRLLLSLLPGPVFRKLRTLKGRLS